MASPTASISAKALPHLMLPSREARRTRHRRVEPLPKGLDAWAVTCSGYWHRRPAITKGLLSEAQQIDAQSGEWTNLSDARLRSRLDAFHENFKRGGKLLTPSLERSALAAVREVALRRLGLFPFVEQLMGALALRRGYLAEMATGEGKTLTAALAAVLAGWTGKPCHVITVNDYLAERDAERMNAIFRFCGLHAGVVTGKMEPPERRQAYAAPITYTTSKEVVADFLRDRLQLGPLADASRRHLSRLINGSGRDPLVMRGLHTAIVDEADSVLIDEAVTPLIISRETKDPALQQACQAAFEWSNEWLLDIDYRRDEAFKQIEWLAAGKAKLAATGGRLQGIWRGPSRRAELLKQALAAKEYFHRDKQYVVIEDKVVIVDEFTGRLMPGRTWREGLHQAVEAKEGLPVSAPSETLARISFQRFFRFYQQLSGMTGTAMEAAGELWQVYRLPVVTIPTHRPCLRTYRKDNIFVNETEKWQKIAACIATCHRQDLPVLVGTRHVASSQKLAACLEEQGIPYNLLNAIHHREEARIVAEAGKGGKVTIATNMAGRGTDILLEDKVAERGGLRVIATERHESPRIDRQLFGRCARQGDPGEVEVFVSLEDELVVRHLPMAVRVLLAKHLRNGGAVARQAALAAIRLAQYRAGRQAYSQRCQVLRTDTWVDKALSFTGPSSLDT
jgi:preprotein translocase subunit SecA